MTDADYIDDLALLRNTPVQAGFLLHSLEQAARSIGLYVNANKTKFMYFRQKEAISIQSSKPLKLVDKFTYLSSNISSIEISKPVHIPQQQYLIY